MNVLGLITARGGSKGIPGKNVAACGGKPLVAWSIAASREARCITRTIVSTDDAEIARISCEHGAEAPFLRPAELSTDTATSIDVAKHAIQWLWENEAWATDVLVLLQPTSPLRTGRHVDEAFALLVNGADSVVSVVEVPHLFKPWLVLSIEDGYLEDFYKQELPFDRFRRQGQPVLYARNGPAVIATRARTIEAGSFYGDRSVPYLMSAEDSIDIDEPADLVMADQQLRARSDA